jgi:hypothetical protein
MSESRRAIEALRAGVPNRAAIRLLGTAEGEIRMCFLDNLRRCREKLLNDRQPKGQVLAGGFGAGKSHLLGYLQEVALNDNFVVSWVVISKETPLFDLGKLYVSAMRNATVPKRNDDAMTAVLARLDAKGDAFDRLKQWVGSQQAGLSPLFPALLHLFPHPNTSPERMQQIARFFAGAKISLVNVKQWLREVGATKEDFALKPITQPELVRQRLRFVPRLIAAAGYSGWVLLLDEVELIGRYSLLQRGRSYAELARWLGLDNDEKVPGVVTVAAITDDFTSEVIKKKGDDDQVPRKLAEKNEQKTAERARIGMNVLEKNQVLLGPPSSERLQTSLNKMREFYSDAYNWDATVTEVGEITSSKSMRQYIKSWITAWDIERLYGIHSTIETLVVAPDYKENQDIERPVTSNGDDADEE